MNGLHTAFLGTLGTDPELKYTSTGKAVLNLSVAVSEHRPGGDGAETQWVRVACWEDLAEQLAETLHKGSEVYVEGRLKLNTWTTADGAERHGLSVSAWKVEPLGAIGKRAPQRQPDTERALALIPRRDGGR